MSIGINANILDLRLHEDHAMIQGTPTDSKSLIPVIDIDDVKDHTQVLATLNRMRWKPAKVQ